MSSTPPPNAAGFSADGTGWSAPQALPAGMPPPLPVQLAPAADVVPPGGVLYKVDSSRASFGELWRDTGGPSVLLAWLTKLLRVRIPGSVNDPNVESLTPFRVEYSALPPDISARIGPMLREWSFVGFDTSQPVAHAIVDLFNNSRCYMVAVPRADGRAVARVVLRMEGSRVPPKTHFYSDVLSELSDGGFVWTTGARAALEAPQGIRVNRLAGASPGQLWTAHETALRQLGGCQQVRPAPTVQQTLDLLDRHHARVRDFHLTRRLFVPMSELERNNANGLGAAYTQGAAGGFPYPEVLAEMERLQSKKTSWVGGLVILGVSLILFIAAGTGSAGGEDTRSQSRELILLLIPILLFHELGHYLAMKIFRYRNVRMFFIPFFGAAVSGTNYSAPGWKKVIVALMGPVPGIVVGGGLGIAGIMLHHDLLIKAGLLTLILNGSNLIPVLPLDGGRVVQTLLFSRHYAADVIFRAIAALALIAIGVFAGRIFLFLGIAMLLGIPLAWRLGSIAAELKRQWATPPPSNNQKIPPEVAQVIITRLKARPLMGGKQSNKTLAQQALTVYETLCTRPPGWLATAAFGFVHVASVLVALVLAIVLLMARGGPISTFMREAANQPRNRITASDIVMYPSDGVATEPAAAHKAIVANFASTSGAQNAFDSVRPRLAASESVERFGVTLIISFPAGDDAARRRWIDQIEPLTRDFCVTNGQFGEANLRLMCLAPTADAAREIQEQAEEYLHVPGLNLIPPWSPLAAQRAGDWPRYRIARRTYLRLMSAGQNIYSNPRVAALSKKASEANRRGDKAEADRLRAQQSRLIQEIRRESILKITQTSDGSIDPIVADNYLKTEKALQNQNADDEEADDESGPIKLDAPEYQAMAERMGRLPLTGGKATAADERYSSEYGNVSRVGLLITFHFVSFKDPSHGAPALVNWLEGRGCKSMKYEFRTGATPGNPFE